MTINLPWTKFSIIQRKIATFFIIFFGAVLGIFFTANYRWHGTAEMHTILETVAMALSFFVGATTLLRYFSKKNNTFLFLGSAFLGTTLLDGYHLFVTSRFFINTFPSSLTSITTWSWLTSRIFLSVMIWISYLAWRREIRLGDVGKISEKIVYSASILMTITIFIFFRYVDLPQAFLKTNFFNRPFEFIPALFFFLATVGYIRKGKWKSDEFEYLLIISLILGFVIQTFYISRSGQLFDELFNISHVLKIISYGFVLLGSLISMFSIFQRASESADELAVLNELGRKLSAHLNVEQVLIEAYKGAEIILPINSFYLTLVNPETLEPIYALKVIDGDIQKAQSAPRRGVTDHMLDTRQPLLFPDNVQERVRELGIKTIAMNPEENSSSWVGVPILLGDQVLGTMVALNYDVQGAYNENHLNLLLAISTQMAVAIQNANLYEASQAATRAKGMFLANMSHEIRTPLNAILGYSQLLQRDTSLSQAQIKKLKIIGNSGEHLLELINDILEMSKIEAQQITLTSVTFDLYALLNDIESMFRIRAEAKNLSLDFELGGDVPQFIISDEGKLRQILINLLGNAVKFTKEGGVLLRTEASRLEAEGNQEIKLSFEVEDTGSGISEEDLSRIFLAFEQSSQVGQRSDGTGLGLAISREYAQLMNGDVSVTSELNRGSVFRVSISAVVGQKEKARRQSDSRKILKLKPEYTGLRAMVVDDRETNRDLLFQLLSEVGFQVQQAADGLEAIELYKQWNPELILMDLVMPNMSGQEAARKIMMISGDTSSPVIIAVTASVLEDDLGQISADGMRDFIRKPFRDKDLLEKIRRHLEIEYLYEDDKGEEILVLLEHGEIKEILQEIPSNILTELQLAASALDTDKLTQLINSVIEINPSAGETIQSMVDNFDFEGLQHILH